MPPGWAILSPAAPPNRSSRTTCTRTCAETRYPWVVAVAAVIGFGYFELLRRGQQIYQILDNPIQTLFFVGTIFIVINYALSKLAVSVERRLSVSGSTSRTGADAAGETAG